MNAILLALCLCGSSPEASLPHVFTWRIQPATVTVPGMTPADFKAKVKKAGEDWSYYANVKIQEAAPGKPPTWIIVLGYKPGTWGTYSPGRITVSTWGPSWKAWAAMTPVQRGQQVGSLIYHESGHGMGCPNWCQTPDQQRAYLKAKWGPPPKRAIGVPDEYQLLPPAPRWRDRAPLLRRLGNARSAIQ
jgi:hypothetical protein